METQAAGTEGVVGRRLEVLLEPMSWNPCHERSPVKKMLMMRFILLRDGVRHAGSEWQVHR